MPHLPFHILYSDIGGVLGTNGWDAALRRKVAARFHLDLEEIEPRHHLMFDSYERGYMSFEDYLRRVFFGRPRDFTIEDVRDFTYDQSVPWPENIGFFQRVKTANRLKLALISNEGRGITEHRIQKFGLRELADFMVISHCVALRKPDREIWGLALRLAQAKPEESIYVDDREMFVQAAEELGFRAVHHVSLESTKDRFRSIGLEVD
ncbi:MAG: HAD-IA family hydrolase [Acidobacteriaceae bacterium]|nr:HAD-IA family hydrolase [Acidobacteriaceae bacterium]